MPKKYHDLSAHSWFRVGGKSEYYQQCDNITALRDYIKNIPKDLPVYGLGAGSNLLISDDIHDAAFISLTGEFKELSHDGIYITAGAGIHDGVMAKYCAQIGLSGLEFLIGIPGTIGGNIKMNAGAHQQQISDCLIAIDAMDRQGHIHHISANELNFSYRHSDLPHDMICIKAHFELTPMASDSIKKRLKTLSQLRHETQPGGRGSGGSTFKNPALSDLSAWQLIDQCGGRGYRVGGAHFSEKHCNFIINDQNASANDIFLLAETMRERVYHQTGILLEWEIELIGFKEKIYE